MKFAIDRIYNNNAICQNLENGEFTEVSLDEIEGNPKEGDILLLKDNKYHYDTAETTNRKADLQNRLNKLINKKE